MSSRTTNLNLYKPDRTEYVSVITDLNNNWDIIDQAVGELNDLNAIEDITSQISFGSLPAGVSGNIFGIKAYRTGNIVNINFDLDIESGIGTGSIEFTYSIPEALRPLMEAPCIGREGHLLGFITYWNFSLGCFIRLYNVSGVPNVGDSISIQYICKGS